MFTFSLCYGTIGNNQNRLDLKINKWKENGNEKNS